MFIIFIMTFVGVGAGARRAVVAVVIAAIVIFIFIVIIIIIIIADVVHFPRPSREHLPKRFRHCHVIHRHGIQCHVIRAVLSANFNRRRDFNRQWGVGGEALGVRVLADHAPCQQGPPLCPMGCQNRNETHV